MKKTKKKKCSKTMCFTRGPTQHPHFYDVKWRVRSASTEKNQASRGAAPKSKVRNNYIDLEKQIVQKQWFFSSSKRLLSELELMASVEGHPGYRATTHIFSRTLASRPILSVTASRLWPSAKKNVKKKKKKLKENLGASRSLGLQGLRPCSPRSRGFS